MAKESAGHSLGRARDEITIEAVQLLAFLACPGHALGIAWQRIEAKRAPEGFLIRPSTKEQRF